MSTHSLIPRLVRVLAAQPEWSALMAALQAEAPRVPRYKPSSQPAESRSEDAKTHEWIFQSGRSDGYAKVLALLQEVGE